MRKFIALFFVGITMAALNILLNVLPTIKIQRDVTPEVIPPQLSELRSFNDNCSSSAYSVFETDFSTNNRFVTGNATLLTFFHKSFLPLFGHIALAIYQAYAPLITVSTIQEIILSVNPSGVTAKALRALKTP